MKRSLHVVDELRDPPICLPKLLNVGNRLVSIVDTGDGLASRRFAEVLLEAGASPVPGESDAGADLRIVIRGVPASAQARLHAEVLEEAADLVLGAARPALARLLASSTGPS